MQEDEPTAFVTYEKFEKKMLDVMIGGEYKPDIDDTLRQAFLVCGFELWPLKRLIMNFYLGFG